MILDVGCGDKPKGDVNIDLFFNETPHERFKINARKTKNFVLGDAQFLPFRGNVFLTYHSSNLLEHLLDPLLGVKEAYRVASQAVIYLPNNPTLRDHPTHFYAWSKPSLKNFLGVVFPKVLVNSCGRIQAVEDSRFYLMLNRAPVLGKILARVLVRFLRLELVAICIK